VFVWDVLTLVFAGGLSAVAGLANGSWTFGLLTAIIQLTMWGVFGRLLLATIFQPADRVFRSELGSLTSQTFVIVVASAVIVFVQFTVGSEQNASSSLMNVTLLSILVIPGITNTVRARRLYFDATQPTR